MMDLASSRCQVSEDLLWVQIGDADQTDMTCAGGFLDGEADQGVVLIDKGRSVIEKGVHFFRVHGGQQEVMRDWRAGFCIAGNWLWGCYVLPNAPAVPEVLLHAGNNRFPGAIGHEPCMGGGWTGRVSSQEPEVAGQDVFIHRTQEDFGVFWGSNLFIHQQTCDG